MNRKKNILACACLLCVSLFACQGLLASNKSVTVASKSIVTVIDGKVAPYNQLLPGDTIQLLAGVRERILIQNIKGSAEKPIIIQNSGGVVTISTPMNYGISIRNCRYIRLTGQGYENEFYGIQITKVEKGGGIGAGNLSSDFEIDHIYIANTLIAGIYAKTDPDSTFTSTREHFTQYNTLIHDNFLENIGNEGMYIGSTKYTGQKVRCCGRDSLLLPSLLDGVDVYNNVLKNIGWDGIQVSSAYRNSRIHDNIILYDSQSEVYAQMTGIIIGGGSRCDCYNNYIGEGKGDGIESHGLGGYRIFNNIIVNAGKTYKPTDLTQRKYGIFVTDVTMIPDSSIYILNNNIINSKNDAIRFQSVLSKKNLIASNLIINPGSYDLYENDNTAFDGQDAYIMLPNAASDVKTTCNFLCRDIDSAGISKTDYTVLPGSKLINASYFDTKGITFDFLYRQRPNGETSEIGAYEYYDDSIYVYRRLEPILFPNPVNSLLTVKCKFNFNISSEVTLKIYSQTGEAILQVKQPYMLGEYQEVQMDVSSLSSGLYLYTILCGEESASGRFVKSN
jgi:hypothetical protein